MKIYDLELSGHAHRARLLANLLGIEHQLISVDLLNGAHKTPDYLAINPFGQVPALQDGDDTIYDSNAILIYLAAKYDAQRTWLPEDALEAAKVQIWLSKAANEIANTVARARLVTVFGAPYDLAELQAASKDVLFILNNQLKNRDWLETENPTIADVAIYSYVAHAPEGGVDLAPFEHVVSWIKRIEQLPGFVAMPVTNTDAKKALAA